MDTSPHSNTAPSPDPQEVWARFERRLSAWAYGHQDLWRLVLPSGADWLMIHVVHGHGAPAISFPDPYAPAPARPAAPHTPKGLAPKGAPVPKGWCSEWSLGNVAWPALAPLSAHRSLEKTRLLQAAEEGCMYACAAVFPLLDARASAPVLFRIKMHRSMGVVCWNVALGLWEKRRSQWNGVDAAHPNLGFANAQMSGEIVQAAEDDGGA